MKNNPKMGIRSIKNNLTSYEFNPRTNMTDRQTLAKRCGYSLSHVTNMLNNVRTAQPNFLTEARTLAERNVKAGRV
jgi:hypothetical protein